MSEDDLIEANPCKLRNGNWGCKTQAPVAVGDTVRIVTRNNKQWRARITQIVWTDDTVCICETESEDRKSGGDKPASSKKAEENTTTASSPRRRASQPSEPASDDAAPPRTDVAPTEELDAMADRAAEADNENDDVMAEAQAFEQEQHSR